MCDPSTMYLQDDGTVDTVKDAVGLGPFWKELYKEMKMNISFVSYLFKICLTMFTVGTAKIFWAITFKPGPSNGSANSIVQAGVRHTSL